MGFIDGINMVEFKPVERTSVNKIIFRYEEMDSQKWYLYENFPDNYGIEKPSWMGETEWRAAMNPYNYRSDTAMMDFIERKNTERKTAEYNKTTAWQKATIPTDIDDDFERMNHLLGVWQYNMDRQDGSDMYVTPAQLQHMKYRAAGGTEPYDIYRNTRQNSVQYGAYAPQYQQTYYQPQQAPMPQSDPQPFTSEMKKAIESEINERVAGPVFAPQTAVEQATLTGFQQRLAENRRNRGAMQARYMSETYNAQSDSFTPPLAGDIVNHTSDVVNFPRTYNGAVVYNANNTVNNPYYANYGAQNNGGYNEFGEYNPSGIPMYHPHGIVNYQRYQGADIPIGNGIHVNGNGKVTRLPEIELFNVAPKALSNPAEYVHINDVHKMLRGEYKPPKIESVQDSAVYLSGFNVTGIEGVEEEALRLREQNPGKNNTFYYNNGTVPLSNYQKIYDKDMELVADNYQQFLAGRRRTYGTQYAIPRNTIPRPSFPPPQMYVQQPVYIDAGETIEVQQDHIKQQVSEGGDQENMVVEQRSEDILQRGKVNIHYTNDSEPETEVVQIDSESVTPDTSFDDGYGDDDGSSSGYVRVKNKKGKRYSDEEMRVKKGYHQSNNRKKNIWKE